MAFFNQSPTRNLPEGYTFRGATLQDIPAIFYLFNQRQVTLNAGVRPEDFRLDWQAAGFNPAMDVRLIFDRREHLAGYIEFRLDARYAEQPWLWGCVHPAFEGQGIGTALLRWAEARVALAHDLFAGLPAGVTRFAALHTLPTAPALCQALGWRAMQEPERPAHKNTGALRLIRTELYDIYEKEIN